MSAQQNGGGGGGGEAAGAQKAIKLIESIWEVATKFIDPQGKDAWNCTFCNKDFSGYNASKATAHVLRTSGLSIMTCKATLSNAEMASLQGLVDKDAQGKRKRDSIGAACDSEAARGEARQEIVACNLEASAARSSNTIVKTTDGPLKDAFHASASTLLTASIADLVFAHGLSDGLPKAWRFRKVLKLAKLVPSAYVTPGPKLVGGALLNHTYNIYKIEMEGRLKRDYPIFGLTALGDGSLYQYQVHVLLIGEIALHVCCARCSNMIRLDLPRYATGEHDPQQPFCPGGGGGNSGLQQPYDRCKEGCSVHRRGLPAPL